MLRRGEDVSEYESGNVFGEIERNRDADQLLMSSLFEDDKLTSSRRQNL